MRALPVDHVGVLASAIDAVVEQYRWLGFGVVGPAELSGVDADGTVVSLGQQSAHVMFADSYIELTAVSNPSPDHHLAEFLGEPFGLRLVILRSGDIELSRERCARGALEPGAVNVASRRIDYGRPGTARFRWFALPKHRFPEALVCYVQHDTHDTVFQPEVAAHNNGAVGLSRILMTGEVVPKPYASLMAHDGGTVLDVRPRPAMEALLATDVSTCPPFAGIGLAVEDLMATRRWLDRNRVPCREVDEGVVVSPQHAGGAGLLFESRARMLSVDR